MTALSKCLVSTTSGISGSVFSYLSASFPLIWNLLFLSSRHHAKNQDNEDKEVRLNSYPLCVKIDRVLGRLRATKRSRRYVYLSACQAHTQAIPQVLDDYAKKMRDAENESHEGKRKAESLWPIMRISHTRSRYVYELYYKREAISRELYDWLLKEGYADAKCVPSALQSGQALTPSSV